MPTPASSSGIEIPSDSLSPETLRALIEEYVTRSGTDYGSQEASLDRKVGDVLKQIERGEVCIVFDPATETADLREAPPKHRPFSKLSKGVGSHNSD
jgi:uncharacterized protein YheU (UPF0270 family)